MLATFAAGGDIHGVRRVIAADPGAVNEVGLDGTTPLCAATLWGHVDVVRLLLESMASPDLRNENGPRWTALHAASLQELGKASMLLLEKRANPDERDTEGVTPCDYASCSEALWPLFAARGCTRTPKEELVQKGVLRRASNDLEQQLRNDGNAESASSRRGVVTEYSRPGSSYVVSREFPPRPGSSAGARLPGTGSGGYARPGTLGSARPGSRANTGRPIDILAEEEPGDTAAEARAETGLRSLQI